MASHPTFIVIGAQKSATTSLFQWLREHPEVYLPAQKELEFFSSDDMYKRGFSFYCERWFGETTGARAIGEVSPQYMMSSETPARIARHLPEVKLVAILRNPIDRAFSHYMMSLRRGLESQSFAKAVDVLCARGEELAAEVDDLNYVSAGLYGRILGGFSRFFSMRSLKVLFYEELRQDPSASVRDVYGFIGVEPNFVPTSIRTEFHRGALRKRFPRFEAWMMRQTTLKHLVKSIVPRDRLSSFLFWFDTELNVVRSTGRENTSPEEPVRKKLQQFYAQDVKRLERLLGRDVPWGEFGRPNAEMRRSAVV